MADFQDAVTRYALGGTHTNEGDGGAYDRRLASEGRGFLIDRFGICSANMDAIESFDFFFHGVNRPSELGLSSEDCFADALFLWMKQEAHKTCESFEIYLFAAIEIITIWLGEHAAINLENSWIQFAAAPVRLPEQQGRPEQLVLTRLFRKPIDAIDAVYNGSRHPAFSRNIFVNSR